MSLLDNAKLISNATGEEIRLYSRVPDVDGHNCLVEALIDHPEGDMVVISHEAAGAHNVFPHVLNARIERAAIPGEDETTPLKILRILSWPYRYPPLSWLSALTSWIAETNTRLIASWVVSAAVIVVVVILRG